MDNAVQMSCAGALYEVAGCLDMRSKFLVLEEYAYIPLKREWRKRLLDLPWDCWGGYC